MYAVENLEDGDTILIADMNYDEEIYQVVILDASQLIIEMDDTSKLMIEEYDIYVNLSQIVRDLLIL